jgi:dihydropteroate synthase
MNRPTWTTAAGLTLASNDRPRVMGILNVTPDSFSDGGLAFAADDALERARELARQGADLLDIGGESTRPGAEPVAPDEQLRRVLGVVAGAARATGLPLSIDTTRAEVARACLAAGACVVNDVSALADDPDMARVVADAGAAVVLMHRKGTPRTMQDNPVYDDVVAEVYEFLARRIEWAEARGVARAQVAIDPGIGFGKTIEHNLSLLRNLDRFASLGCAMVVGTSRKRFLGAITGRDVADRVMASVASALASADAGAGVVRVHDVAATVDAFQVWNAQRGWGSRA